MQVHDALDIALHDLARRIAEAGDQAGGQGHHREPAQHGSRSHLIAPLIGPPVSCVQYELECQKPDDKVHEIRDGE